jgi:hypothetical protein
MRALLRSKRTGLYYRGQEQWTANPAHAHDFELGTRAIQHAYDAQFRDVEIVFCSADGQHDLTVPIADRHRRPTETPRAQICRDGKLVQVM